jgi:hypothetical protein
MLFMHPASSMHTIQACLLLYLPDNSMPYQTERALTMQPCSISRFSILQQILFIVFIFSAGIALYISTSAYFFSISKVNGPIYRQIIQGKDLIADILPPPEYIIESYLVALQAQDQTPGKQLETQQKNLTAFKRNTKNGMSTGRIICRNTRKRNCCWWIPINRPRSFIRLHSQSFFRHWLPTGVKRPSGF